MNQNYKGVIWTTHALQRLVERGIKQSDAYYTFSNPQESRYAKTKGAWIYFRTYGSNKVEVVASKNKEGRWVIMSVWSKPVFEKYYILHKPSEIEKKVDSLVEKTLQKILGRFRK